MMGNIKGRRRRCDKNECVLWHHCQCNGYELEQILGDAGAEWGLPDLVYDITSNQVWLGQETIKGSVLIPFFYFYLSRFSSSTYKGSYILSIVYYCTLRHRLDKYLDNIYFQSLLSVPLACIPIFFLFFPPHFLFLFFFFTSFMLCALLQFCITDWNQETWFLQACLFFSW